MDSSAGRRIRIRFDDPTLLSPSQVSHGLRRCWLFFQPSQHLTISDLVSHLLDKFSLQSSCPDGLVLFMNGYVLPPFESTSILVENDIIRVKKLNNSGVKAIELYETEEHSSGSLMFEEKQTMNLLAIKASGDDEDECQSSEHERVEELPSEIVKSKKKRKSLLQLKRVKKRRKSSSTNHTKADTVADIADNTIEEIDKNVPAEAYAINERLPQKETRSKTKRSTKKVVPENNARDDFSPDHHKPNSPSLAIINKVPSRSARRKKAKRLWLRKQAKIQLENSKIDTEEINQNCVSLKNVCGTSSDKVNGGHKNLEAEVVPVVIRPGHIRFEPLDDSDSDKRKPMETIQWNGTISKKKGQQWGKETTFVCKKKLDKDSDDFSLSRVHDEDEFSADEDQQPCSTAHNFENLRPLTSSPKVGDILAYRLIELSSSWSPELSSFRVGKVASVDLASNQIVLVPLPEYPVKHGDSDDADAANSTSLYKEDGSLEIDYASLVDVRYVEENTCTESVCKNGDADEKNREEPVINNSMNGKVSHESDPWEELSKAFDDKKVQLLQQEAARAKRSWSYRGLRGSALGPTIARLRAQNDL